VTGSYVEYDIEKQTMLARPDLGKQTMMVLNPKQKQS
jgi:lipopolysaccharide export system protein LptA